MTKMSGVSDSHGGGQQLITPHKAQVVTQNPSFTTGTIAPNQGFCTKKSMSCVSVLYNNS